MNTQEIEQVVLAVSQSLLLLNQLFMTKKMKEGMSKIAGNKDKLNDVNNHLNSIVETLSTLEDRMNDLINTINELIVQK